MVAPFEGDDTIKRDFSYNNLCIMTDILNFKKDETYLTELSKGINVKSSNLTRILDYLKKIKIIKVTNSFGNVLFFKIDKRLLKHFIDEQDNYFVDNFHKKYNKITYKELQK